MGEPRRSPLRRRRAAPAGSDEATRAADVVADAFRELGLETRFQEFDLLAYDADEPQLEVEGERWDAGPCMYAHPFDGEGSVKRIGESDAPVGDGKLPNFAVVDADGREVARLLTSPFSTGAIPFMSSHVHITTPPTAFVSLADSARLRDGMRVRLKVGGRFIPGRRERNVIAELPGASEKRVLVCAHFDSVWRGPGRDRQRLGCRGSAQDRRGARGTRPAAHRAARRVHRRGDQADRLALVRRRGEAARRARRRSRAS